MSSIPQPGYCVVHGYHGMQVCPRCSTGVPVPLTPPQPTVDPLERIADALERIAEALASHTTQEPAWADQNKPTHDLKQADFPRGAP